MSTRRTAEVGLGFKYPAVLIFGAGATRGGLPECLIPPPVDREFFDIAGRIEGRGTRDLAKRVLKSVWEIFGRTSGVGLEEYYREIETRAEIGQFAKSRNQPKDWAKRKTELEELIRRVYIHTTMDLSGSRPQPKTSEVHTLLLSKLKPSCTVITFNYDLLIEESFGSASLWNPRDGYGLTVSGISHDWCRKWQAHRGGSNGESTIHLLKLHGSLGWVQYKNKNIRLKDRPYVVRKGRFEKISILPPGWNKPIGRNPYKKFWREARLKLETCKSLFVLGYSLPETDLLARALFSEVVRLRAARKEYLRKLVLVDPSDEVKGRFIDLFAPALGPHGTVYKYQSMSDLKRLLDPERSS